MVNKTLEKTNLIHNRCNSSCLGLKVEVGTDEERPQGRLFRNFLHYDLAGSYMSVDIYQNSLYRTLE